MQEHSEQVGPVAHHDIPHVENPFEEKAHDEDEAKSASVSNSKVEATSKTMVDGAQDKHSGDSNDSIGETSDSIDEKLLQRHDASSSNTAPISARELDGTNDSGRDTSDYAFEEPGIDADMAKAISNRFPLEPGLIHTWSMEDQTSGEEEEEEEKRDDAIQLEGVHQFAEEMRPVAHINEEAVQDALIQAAEDAMRFAYEETARKQSEQHQQGDTFIQHQLAEMLVRQRQSLLRLGEMETRLETMESLVAKTLHTVTAINKAGETHQQQHLREQASSSMEDKSRGDDVGTTPSSRQQKADTSGQNAAGANHLSTTIDAANAPPSFANNREGQENQQGFTRETTSENQTSLSDRSHVEEALQGNTPTGMSAFDASLSTMLPVPPSFSTGASTPRDGTWLLAKLLALPSKAARAGQALLFKESSGLLPRWFGQERWDLLQTRIRAILWEAMISFQSRFSQAYMLAQSQLHRIKNSQHGFRGVFVGVEEKALVAAAISALVTLAFLVRKKRTLHSAKNGRMIGGVAGLGQTDGNRVAVHRAVIIT